MDPLRLHAYKIHAIRKHKRQQFVGTVLLYSFLALACTLLCSSTLWYPPFCATFNVIFFSFLPKLSSFFFTSKVLFVVGNLIVIFLVGESKFLASKTKQANSHNANYCYDKYKRKSPEIVCTPKMAKKGRGLTTPILESREKEKKVEMVKSYDDQIIKYRREEVRMVPKVNLADLEQGGEEVNYFPAEEVNKLADDFIARVNRQRRLEAEFCRI